MHVCVIYSIRVGKHAYVCASMGSDQVISRGSTGAVFLALYP